MMYNAAFTHVYNEFGWNTFAEMFGDQLKTWLRDHKFTPRNMLDLGCGTGVLCALFARDGIDAVGVDLSEDMLIAAREKCPRAEFIRADMTKYIPDRSFDLITSTGDALNHIPDLADVRRAFQNVRASLTANGVFIFDVMAYSDLQNGDSFEMNDDSTSASFEIERSDQTIRMRITVSDAAGNLARDTVTEIIHDPDTLLRMLKESGFSRAEMTKQLLPGFDHPAGAMYFIAYP